MGNVKTLDKKDVEFNDYKKTCIELCKGLVTKEEVKYVGELIELHNNAIKAVVDTIRKLANKQKTTDDACVRNWLMMEKDLAIEYFNKTEQCLDRVEHLQILNLLLDEALPLIADIQISQLSGSEESAVGRQYLAGRKFTDNEKLYKN